MYDRGARCDMEAGMAKLFATEAAMENAAEAMRVHGGYGYSKEFPIERLYRDAPLLVIGEGTNELQRIIIARQLTRYAAERYDSGQRCDMEAGMAKLFASEVAMEIALNAVRIHGGYGYSTEYDVERYFRDAPLMIVGEGTNEIQRNVIAAQLVARGGI
jgi:alkylation response protein AidB-like acyl-CoA dehydrogenase